MNKVLLDSSAVLALLFEEAGADLVLERGGNAAISTANYCEVLSKLTDRGAKPHEANALLASLNLEPIPVSVTHAIVAAELRQLARAKDLSLGDRLCLACARVEKLEVMTADKLWTKLNFGVNVTQIRP